MSLETHRSIPNSPLSLSSPLFNYFPFYPYSFILLLANHHQNLNFPTQFNQKKTNNNILTVNLGFLNRCTLRSMAGMLRTKRKEAAVDDVSEGFGDFSLISPARKIRRLDADLPPVMEEEVPAPAPAFEKPSGVVIEELTPDSCEENSERAIVVFNSVGASNPKLCWPAGSGFSVSMDSDLLSGLKSKHKQLWVNDEVHDEEEVKKRVEANECMAVVPWVSSQFASATDVTQTDNAEFMEDEDVGEAAMEIEDGNNIGSLEQTPGFQFGGVPQWQQQHCMVPQLPQSNPTPVTWFPVASNDK